MTTDGAQKSSVAPRRPGAPKRKERMKREDIVREATKLFAQRGYDGASMADLAEVVGLRKASLFHHFPSKDALYAEVLAALVAEVGASISRAQMGEGSFAERLDALSETLTETLGSRPSIARLLVREALDHGPVMQRSLGPGIQQVLQVARAFVEAGQHAGAFDDRLDPAQVVTSLIGVHFMPFAIADVVEGFTGASPFGASGLAARKRAVVAQVRSLVLARR